MSLSLGASEISPLSMFASLGTTPGGLLRRSSASTLLTHGDGRARRDAHCLRQISKAALLAAEADTVFPQAVRQYVSAGGRTEPARRLIR
jgi:hypothetical protein